MLCRRIGPAAGDRPADVEVGAAATTNEGPVAAVAAQVPMPDERVGGSMQASQRYYERCDIPVRQKNRVQNMNERTKRCDLKYTCCDGVASRASFFYSKQHAVLIILDPIEEHS